MVGNFFQRSTVRKQRVNKKQNVEIGSPASSGGEVNYTNYVTFSWPPLEAALLFFKFILLLLRARGGAVG
jgi:hypothetical protein